MGRGFVLAAATGMAFAAATPASGARDQAVAPTEQVVTTPSKRQQRRALTRSQFEPFRARWPKPPRRLKLNRLHLSRRTRRKHRRARRGH